jgi:hypothetical protein
VHGQATAQLQLSNQSPAMCQLEVSLIGDLRSRLEPIGSYPNRRQWRAACLGLEVTQQGIPLGERTSCLTR